MELAEKYGLTGPEALKYATEQKEKANERAERALAREKEREAKEREKEREREEREKEREAREREKEKEREEREKEREEREKEREAREKEKEKEREEREKERQHELELERLRAERDSVTDHSQTATTKKPKLPAFVDGKDDLDAYLARFERTGGPEMNGPQTFLHC